MKEKAALVITHGKFGIELVKSLEMIMGEQENILTLGINPGDDVERVKDEAEQYILKNSEEGRETLVFVDILGGSPSNIGLYLLKKYTVSLITGVNMTMLIEFFSHRELEEEDELIEKVLNAGNEGMKKFVSDKDIKVACDFG